MIANSIDSELESSPTVTFLGHAGFDFRHEGVRRSLACVDSI
jgi:hypothetical protein